MVVWLGSRNDKSCSGIILDFNRGLVLTTGSLFREYFDRKCLAKGKSVVYWEPASISPKDKVKDGTKDTHHIGVQVLLKNDSQLKDEKTFLKHNLHDGRLIILWRDNNISKLLNEIFPVSVWDFKNNQEMESDEIKKVAFTSVTDNLQTEIRQKLDSDVPSIFLSVFAVIHVPDLKKIAALNISKSYLSPLSERITSLSRVLINLPTPQVGDPVKIIGTPFGFECPSVFFNCVSKGIISNLAGSNSELIVTDARAAPGSEGSPLYLESACSDGNSMLLGMVLAPFCWRNGEWIGITLACTVKQVLSSLYTALLQSGYESGDDIFTYLMLQISDMNRDAKAAEVEDSVSLKLNKQSMPLGSIVDKFHSFSQQFIAGKELHRLLESVVLVEAGKSWGSGVIINPDEGLVLSCSHVVRENIHLASLNNCKSDAYTVNRGSKTCMIRTGAPDFAWQEGKILFSTSPESAIDLSLLKVERKADSLKDMKSGQGNSKNLSFSKIRDYHFLNLSLMKKGDPVVVVGYAMFGSGDLKIGPSVTAGVLSNVVYVEGQVIMLQTTAAVHCGASGGAVFSTQTGEFLGLVTCNTKDASTSASFPHINFAVPSGLIKHFLQKVLQNFESQSFQISVPPGTQDIWSLKKTPFSSHI